MGLLHVDAFRIFLLQLVKLEYFFNYCNQNENKLILKPFKVNHSIPFERVKHFLKLTQISQWHFGVL